MESQSIPSERQFLAATPRNRLHWLSQLFHAPLARRADPIVRIAVALLLAIVAGGALWLGVVEAIEYHPIYVERMRSDAPTQGAAADERPKARQ